MFAIGLRVAASVMLVLAVAGCDRLFPRDSTRTISEADKKVSTGDFRGALRLYEAALDGTSRTAVAHYKLALLYDGKLKRPRDAVHHIDRYLELAPSGDHARDARKLREENEHRITAAHAAGAPMSQAEAARLKNRIAELEHKLSEVSSARKAATPPPKGKTDKVPPGARKHLVKSGETLASISRQYYRTPAKAKDILDANFNALNGKDTIRAGQTLIIP